LKLIQLNEWMEELIEEFKQEEQVAFAKMRGKPLREPKPGEVEHERMRVATLGDRKLATRLGKITNPQKLFAFAQALDDAGNYRLAQMAWAKLADLGWDSSGEPIS
jgi:hypothetical protein